MIDEVALNRVLDELTATLGGHNFATPSAVNPCQVWQTIRPGIVTLIGLLNEAGALFPKAKLAAQALDALRKLLDTLCQIPPTTNPALERDPLADELAQALHPGAAAPAAAETPCEVWSRLRPVVDQIVTTLKDLAKFVPQLAQVADIIGQIEKLLNSLCDTQSGKSVVMQLSAMKPAPFAVRQSPHASPSHKSLARNYVKYPVPKALRPRTGGPFKVADLCRAYHFPTGLGGGGVIGILELGGGYLQSDLDLFSSLNGLPRINVSDRSVNQGTNSPGGPADGEVLLDIQVAAAVYFYCTGTVPSINVYFAPNSGASFVDVMQAAVGDGCDVLSISWGGDEGGWSQADAQQVENVAQATTQAGCVIFAASGDNSSGDGTPGANVDMPSSCPSVIGCGGTTKGPATEVVWGNGIPNGIGTGGGFSSLFPLQPWQIGAPAIAGSRMVPDVAADADPETGYLVVINGQETPIGGTSAVAPLYSGLFASFGRKLGFITPTLWKNPGSFQDIVKGSNGSFSAAVGPDPCTGLGVPIGDSLAALFGPNRGGK